MTTATGSAAGARQAKEIIFAWEGKDRIGKKVTGELRAGGEAIVNATLRRQGILVTKVKKKTFRSGKKVTDKDISLFTRQLATMMKAGVPLLQSLKAETPLRSVADMEVPWVGRSPLGSHGPATETSDNKKSSALLPCHCTEVSI